MAVDFPACQRSKVAIRAMRALVSFLVADSSSPFIGTDRLIASLSRCPAEPSSCKNIRSSLEKATEQCYFLIRREIDRRKYYRRKNRLLIRDFRYGIDNAVLRRIDFNSSFSASSVLYFLTSVSYFFCSSSIPLCCHQSAKQSDSET